MYPTEETKAADYIAVEIDRAPEPLRRLGVFLADHLDEDAFKSADRMLLGAIEAANGMRDALAVAKRWLEVAHGQKAVREKIPGIEEEWTIDLTAGIEAVDAALAKASAKTKRFCNRCGGEGELIEEAIYWTDRTQDRACPVCDGTGYEIEDAA